MNVFLLTASPIVAPLASAHAAQVRSVEPGRIELAQRGHDRGLDRPRYRHRELRRGRHHRRPPRGYRRYHVRPRDWRARRCIAIGPAWFCP